jgi:succinyl-diaminopimelate desuccinylase
MTAMDQRAVELAQALIRCRSVTPEDGGAIELLDATLAKAGARCHRLTFADTDTPKVENLYARLGEGPPHLAFAGHTDVVPPGDESLWSHPPFAAEIAGARLYGRGAADMKGAIAAFVAAALDFARTKGDTLDGSISFIITGDEEGPAINGTRKVLDWMSAKDERPDHCLVGEPTNQAKLGETIKIGRRGSLNGTLTVIGVQGHVAYPHLANNPVKGLIRVLDRFYAEPLDYGSAHFSASNLEVTSIDVGNEAVNVIPAKAQARFNIRYNDRHEPSSLQALLRLKATEALAGTDLDATFTFEPPSHAFITVPGPLDALLSDAVREVTGLNPTLSTDGGTSDARFIKDNCPVVEFGLLTATIHKIDEHVALADLAQLTAIYRRFIELYFDMFQPSEPID